MTRQLNRYPGRNFKDKEILAELLLVFAPRRGEKLKVAHIFGSFKSAHEMTFFRVLTDFKTFFVLGEQFKALTPAVF